MTKKKTYRVYATMTTDLYLDVEAESIEEALEIARDTDGGEFIEEGWTGGEWSIGTAVEIEPQKTSKNDH